MFLYCAGRIKNAIWCPALENIALFTGSSVILESDEVSVQIKVVKGDLIWFRYSCETVGLTVRVGRRHRLPIGLMAGRTMNSNQAGRWKSPYIA